MICEMFNIIMIRELRTLSALRFYVFGSVGVASFGIGVRFCGLRANVDPEASDLLYENCICKGTVEVHFVCFHVESLQKRHTALQ